VSIACALILLVAAGGGLVRALPWLVAEQVPILSTVPFAQLLVARGLEVAILVGVPMGVAIAAALFVERGEARALAALGARPARLVAGLVLPGSTVIAVAALAIGFAEPSSSEARLPAALIEVGRNACAERREPRRVDVPLLSLAWLCFEQGPRLVGAVPGLRGALWFTASALRPLNDVSGVDIDELRLAGALSPLRLSLRARTAHVSGLDRWGSPRRMNGIARGALVGMVALFTGLACAWAIVRAGLAHPMGATAAAGAAALAALAALRALDAAAANPAVYALAVPCGGLAGPAFLFLAAGLRSRIAVRRA
jgi:hypothetical protein